MAAGAPPFQITVYSSGYGRRGTVGRPRGVSGAIRTRAAGDWQFTVDADDRRSADLVNGARVRVDYRFDQHEPLSPLISGVIEQVAGTGTGSAAQRTFQVTDDWSDVFNGVTGWPNPTGTIAQQGANEAYFTRTGPAETVLKQIVAPNVARVGIPLTIPPTAGLGSSITCSIRMHSLFERLYPAVVDAGIVARVLQLGAERTLVVSAPTVRTQVLTQGSGVVSDVDWSLKLPTVTRVVVGAGGEAEARIFREFRNDGTAGRPNWETALYGTPGKPFVREAFVDARDVGLDEGATALTAAQEATLKQRAEDKLTEGAPGASLTAKLAETPRWRYGRKYLLGDILSVRPSGGPVLTGDVQEVDFEWQDDGRPLVTPLVGAWADTQNDKIMRQIADAVRVVRDMQRST